MSYSKRSSSTSPPCSDELEVTVFGPGVGECIVLHLGADDWVIIDSCVLTGNDEPVALQYLNEIGVPTSKVRRVIATHWHDDHIQGLAQVLRECQSAEFAMSAALSGQQFLQLVLEINAQNRLVKHSSSASEFAEILEVLQARAASRYAAGPDIYAHDGVRLFQGGHDGTAEIWAVSPSAAAMTNANANLAELLLTKGAARRFKRFSPNDLSVAIVVRVADFAVLLGADLENTAAKEFGWNAVLASNHHPRILSRAFKVPHHGSANAHHDGVWTAMLAPRPLALVTPYAKLRDPLPTKVDIQRLKGLAEMAYCTTWPTTKKPARRWEVDGTVRTATRIRRALNSSSGHVRLRFALSDSTKSPTVELFGSATKL